MTWDLPENWAWTPIPDLLTPVRTQARPDDIHDDWVYVGLEHVQSQTGEYEGVEAGGADIRSNKFMFELGDVLYGKLRPNLRKCVVARTSGVCSTDLVPLRPVDPEAADFIALQLRSEPFTANVMRMIGGANLPRVNLKDLFTLTLPMPLETEASRIYQVARAVTALRVSQRELAAAIDMVERAASAQVLGLAAPLAALVATPSA